MAKETTKTPTKPGKLGKTSNKDNRDVKYQSITITCACGASYESGSTLEKIHVDICANCHPFFTGENRILDAEGRVEKFRKKYNM